MLDAKLVYGAGSKHTRCSEVCELLAAIQTCVDREGYVIPARSQDFRTYVERAREYMGVPTEKKQRVRPWY